MQKALIISVVYSIMMSLKLQPNMSMDRYEQLDNDTANFSLLSDVDVTDKSLKFSSAIAHMVRYE